MLIKSLLGLTSPQQKEASLHCQGSHHGIGSREYFKRLSYCPQLNTVPHEFSCAQLFRFFSLLKSSDLKQLPSPSSSLFGIDPHSQTQFKKLSAGAKRKVMLALSVLGSPRVVLLDEPLSGLDSQSAQSILASLRKIKEGRSILVVAHEVEELARVASKCLLLSRGQIIREFSFHQIRESISCQLRVLFTLSQAEATQLRTRAVISNETEALLNRIQYNTFHEHMSLRELAKFLHSLPLHHHKMIHLSSVTSDDFLLRFIEEYKATHEGFTSSTKNQALNLITKNSYFSPKQRHTCPTAFKYVFTRRFSSVLLGARSLLLHFLLLFAILLDFSLGYVGFFQLHFHFSILFTIYLNEMVVERAQSHHLACFHAGISVWPFTLATLLADSLVCLLALYVLLFVSIISFPFYNIPFSILYTRLALVTLPYSLASISFVYLLSFLFVDPFTGYGFSQALISHIFVNIYSHYSQTALLFPQILGGYLLEVSLGMEQSPTPVLPSPNFLSDKSFSLLFSVLWLQFAVYFLLTSSVSYFAFSRHLPASQKRYQGETLLRVSVNDCTTQQQIELELRPNESIGVLGPSQSGKTQLFNHISEGKSQKFKGEAKVKGASSKGKLPWSSIGSFSSASPQFGCSTLFWSLIEEGKMKGIRRPSLDYQILYFSFILDLREHLFKRVSHLSGGTLQKARLIGVLLGFPELVLIDDPTQHLDQLAGRDLMMCLRYLSGSLRFGLLFSAKRCSEVEFGCEKYLALGKRGEQGVSPRTPFLEINFELENESSMTLVSPTSVRELKMGLSDLESKFRSRLQSISSTGL